MPGTIAYKETAFGECMSKDVVVVVRTHKVRKAEIQYKDASTD